MEKCNTWKLFSLVTAAIVFLVLPVPMVTAKVDARVDIAVILQRDHTIGERNEMAAYKKLGTFFEFGDEKTRFAIMFYVRSVPMGPPNAPIYFTTDNPMIMNVSGSSALYDQKMVNYKIPPSWGLNDGSWKVKEGDRDKTLNLVGHNVFPGYRPANRARVLFYIVTEPASDLLYWFESYAKHLHSSGVWIYMFVRNGQQKDLEAARLATSRDRIFISKDRRYDKKLADEMVKVKDAILRDLCQWETVCRYESKEQTKCVRESHMPPTNPFMDNVKQCDAVKPSDPCNRTDCLDECDKRWPYEKKPACDGKCGTKAYGTRKGNAPKYMEFCPTWIECPSCPSTTEVTTSTSTSSSSSSTTSSTTTVIADGTSSGGPHGQHGTIGTEPPVDSISLTTIIIAAIGGAVLLILLVLVILLITRKKRKPPKTNVPSVPSVPPKMAVKKSVGSPAGKEALLGNVRTGVHAAVAADLTVLGTTRTHPSSADGDRKLARSKLRRQEGTASSKVQAGLSERPKERTIKKK